MERFHVLLVDAHNPNKGHHISFDQSNGRAYYNQAIKQDDPDRVEAFRAKYPDQDYDPEVPGHRGWYDFYREDEPVHVRDGNHGYQKYINRAHAIWRLAQPLEVGDVFEFPFNQANREVEILAINENEALGWYEMPAGRKFLAVFHRYDRYDDGYHVWLRSQSVKSLPKKWIYSLSDAYLDFIHDEVG